jgi:hypothetical protein
MFILKFYYLKFKLTFDFELILLIFALRQLDLNLWIEQTKSFYFLF